MIDRKKIERINHLARKAASPGGLTAEETAERDALRREYIDACKASLNAQLDNACILYPDGTRRRLERKKR